MGLLGSILGEVANQAFNSLDSKIDDYDRKCQKYESEAARRGKKLSDEYLQKKAQNANAKANYNQIKNSIKR